MANISNGAQLWGQKVVRAACSEGYLRTSAERHYSVSPIFCFCCPDDRDGKAGLLVPAFLMGVAFFVGLHYALKSMGQAITYNRWRAEGSAQLSLSESLVSNGPEDGTPTPPRDPHPDEAVYRAGVKLLTQMGSERRWTTLGRALLTLGAGAFTVAFLVAMIAEGQIGVSHMLSGGAGAIGGGFVVLSGTRCHFRDESSFTTLQHLTPS